MLSSGSCQSDVPVATFLSGGLDSSLISAIADAHFGAGKPAANVLGGLPGQQKYFHATKFQPGADAPYIRKMNDFLHARHHWVTLDTPELVPALYAAVDARDLPGMADVDASLLVFCRHIKPHATVALSGNARTKFSAVIRGIVTHRARSGTAFPWAQSTAYRVSFIKPGVLGGIDRLCSWMNATAATLAQTSVRPGLPAAERRMRQMINLNFKWFMQTLLDRKDRMSMYSGLEVRVPFCDYRIAEYLYSVPWEFKDWGGQEKGLPARGHARRAARRRFCGGAKPVPQNVEPQLPGCGLGRSCAPYSERPRRAASAHHSGRTHWKPLLASGADNPIPWYGQLMTTPQTIAWFCS